MIIELKAINTRDEPFTIGNATLVNGLVVADHEFARVMSRIDVRNPEDPYGDPLTPDDGARYLEAVPLTVTGTYLWAERSG